MYNRGMVTNNTTNARGNEMNVGTRIYYTGDVANNHGFGEIIEVIPPGKWQGQFVILMDDFRKLITVTDSAFTPGPGRRFWLESEWMAKREKEIAEAKAEYERILANRKAKA